MGKNLRGTAVLFLALLFVFSVPLTTYSAENILYDLSLNLLVPVTENEYKYQTDYTSSGIHVHWYEDGEDLTELYRVDFVDINTFDELRARTLIRHADYPELILVTEITYFDNINQENVVERQFMDVSAIISSRNASGSGNHRVERDHSWGAGSIQTRWASGFFEYNSSNNTARVRNNAGGVNSVSGITVSNQVRSTNTGRTLLGRNWAEANFSFSTRNPAGMTRNFSINARVEANGSRNN